MRRTPAQTALHVISLLGLASVSGLLIALSLPPFDVDALGWVAVAPLLIAAPQVSPLLGVGLGLIAGVVCGATHQYVGPPFLLLALVLGIVAAVAGRVRRASEGLRWVAFTAFTGVAVEWLTTFAPLPLNVALTQHNALPVIQIAAFAGIWGVSFLLWWVNAAMADLLLSWGRSRRPIGAGLWALGAALFAGQLYLLSDPLDFDEPLVKVAAIQECLPGDFPGVTYGSIDPPSLEDLTRRAAARGARLVVCSELCLGASWAPGQGTNETPERLAVETGTHLVVGYSEPGQPKGYNCAALIDPKGKVLGVHRKVHPYLGERNSVLPGKEARAFDTALGRVGMAICFDTCYTSVPRRLAADGARILAMPNFDPPSPRAILHHLHGAILPFRAVENRLPIIRADPNGFSQVIDRCGRVVAEAPLGLAGAVVGEVIPGNGKGLPFTDWLAYASLAAAVILWPRRRVKPS